MKTYFISSHVFYPSQNNDTHGPAHEVFAFLKKRKQNVFFVKHDMLGLMASMVIDEREKTITTENPPKNMFLRFANECKFTFSVVKKYAKRNHTVYIGVDPINGLSGLILKLAGVVSKNIYFSADYADRRYKNLLLNQIYFFFDRVASRFADEVWSVSSRIAEVRRKQRIPDIKNKILPNSPAFLSIRHIRYDGNLRLVIVSNLQDTLDLQPILEAMKVAGASFPKLELLIIGSGPKEDFLRALVKKMRLTSHVTFAGQKNHGEVIDLIVHSFLGIAFYRPNGGNKYGDSMKVREYLAAGIPVIMNDIPATADDVQKGSAGLVLHSVSSKKISDFLEKCANDKRYYNKLRKNALALGKLFDKDALLQSLLMTR